MKEELENRPAAVSFPNRAIYIVLTFLIPLGLMGCEKRDRDNMDISSSCIIRDGESDVLTPHNFLCIKEFVLAYGDRQTYCNMYNNNPHYQFEDFSVYLDPERGQFNINCDPNLSDFNEIVIRTSESVYQYCQVGISEGPNEILKVSWAHVQISPEILKTKAEVYFRKMLAEIDQQENSL